MTNNTPDYNDNLYFDAQNTKNEQQKDLCIKVEKQVWESTLKASMDRAGRIEILEQQLAIAIETLEKTKSRLLSINIAYLSYNDRNKLYDTMLSDGIIDKALQQIKELDK